MGLKPILSSASRSSSTRSALSGSQFLWLSIEVMASSSSVAFAMPMSLSHSQASVSEVAVVKKDSAPLVTTDSLSVSSCSPLFLRAILYLLFLRSCQPCAGDSHSSDEDSPPVEEEDTTSGPAPPPRRMGLLVNSGSAVLRRQKLLRSRSTDLRSGKLPSSSAGVDEDRLKSDLEVAIREVSARATLSVMLLQWPLRSEMSPSSLSNIPSVLAPTSSLTLSP